MIAGYVRVSTQRQADEGVSIEMQKNLIAKHAHMIEILGKNDDIVFYVDDGFSGSSLQRPKMVELIDDMKSGKISVLLAYDLSRISRDLFDSNSFMRIARKYGVVIKCIYDDIDIETAANRFSTNIKILTNQYERERVIERTNDSLVSIADSGRYPAGGKPPFGYYRGPDKMVCIDEHDSKIVIKIFEMMRKGYDIKDVVSYLGFETDKLKANKDTVLRLVQNTKYIGIYKFKGKEYDDLIPPIIDKKTFEIVNRSFKKIEVKKDDNYLFDGMVFCEKCGCLTKCSHSINHQGKKYYYYVCYSCKKSVSQSTLEKHLFSVHIHHNPMC